LGYAQILEASAQLPDAFRTPVQTIAGSGRHLLGVVNEVLDLSKIEAGCAELFVSEFEVGSLISEIGSLFEGQCRQKGLEFRVDLTNLRRQSVVGDSGRLRQILINLLGNALKFTQQGAISLRARSETNDYCVFEVVDTGVGVPSASLDQILLPFHQERAGRNAGGTGLGLAIAKSCAELMGGTLAVASRLDEGSTFSVTLPLPRPVASANDSLVNRAPRKLALGTSLTALVVDDVLANREVLADMLTDIGCQVVLARDGREALEKAPAVFSGSGERAGVVFLDVRLPDLDGPEVLRQLRDAGLSQLRIVAHSASVFAHERAAYLRAGFDGFLAKPLEMQHLYGCLETIPGVTLREAAEPSLAAASLEPEELILPARLRTAILEAARLHNATALRSCLRELGTSLAVGQPRIDRLRAALRTYDMRTIFAILSERAATTASDLGAEPARGVA
jgi:CheY-like chemotaxis protein